MRQIDEIRVAAVARGLQEARRLAINVEVRQVAPGVDAALVEAQLDLCDEKLVEDMGRIREMERSADRNIVVGGEHG